MNIRSSTPDNASLILTFIQQKSESSQATGSFTGALLATEDKKSETLFGIDPFAYIVAAELSQREPGFGLYGIRHPSHAGQPNIWLDDLSVNGKARSHGAGAASMAQLTQIAMEYGCTHLA